MPTREQLQQLLGQSYQNLINHLQMAQADAIQVGTLVDLLMTPEPTETPAPAVAPTETP